MAFHVETSSASDVEDEAEEPILAEINITPLVDVFLVLLIIFMVTTSSLNQMDFDVALPKTKESSSLGQAEPGGVIITLKSDGALLLNGIPIAFGDWDRFEQVLKTAFQTESGASKSVILQGDERAVLGRAIEVIDRAKRAGAASVSVATLVAP